MKNIPQFFIKGSAMVLTLSLISGCDFFKKKSSESTTVSSSETSKADGAPLYTINGEVAITEGEFLNNLQQMIQANPYFRGATIDSLPKELLRKFFDQLATQALIEKYSVKNSVQNDPEYIKAYNETEKLLKRSLMVQMFEKKIYDGINVSDSDIKKHFAENKDRFVKSAGGVLAMGARFDTEAAADAFMAKAKTNVNDFENLAKADKAGKFKDFGRVSKESKGFQYDVVPAPIKEAVLAMHKLPSVEKIKSGKEFWVVKASDKQDTVLFDIEEVRGHIEGMLKNNLFRDALEKRIKDLKNDFSVTVNEDYFKEKNAEKSEDSEQAKEAAEATEESATQAA